MTHEPRLPPAAFPKVVASNHGSGFILSGWKTAGTRPCASLSALRNSGNESSGSGSGSQPRMSSASSLACDGSSFVSSSRSKSLFLQPNSRA
eukprot:4386152-Prymnesium_polylepis.1